MAREHLRWHGWQLGVGLTLAEYATKALAFIERAIAQKLPGKITEEGTIDIQPTPGGPTLTPIGGKPYEFGGEEFGGGAAPRGRSRTRCLATWRVSWRKRGSSVCGRSESGMSDSTKSSMRGA